MKTAHEFTPISREVDDEGVAGPCIWQWCIRCGALELDGDIFVPGAYQNRVVEPTPDIGCPGVMIPRSHRRYRLEKLDASHHVDSRARLAAIEAQINGTGLKLVNLVFDGVHGVVVLEDDLEAMPPAIADAALAELRNAWSRATNNGYLPQNVRDTFNKILGLAATAKDPLPCELDGDGCCRFCRDDSLSGGLSKACRKRNR